MMMIPKKYEAAALSATNSGLFHAPDHIGSLSVMFLLKLCSTSAIR